MSEPVTHAQIEDVLSSIRRLVSEDNRSDAQPDAPVSAPAETGESAADKVERLVLTPALRVNAPDRAAAAPAEDAPEAAPETDAAGTTAADELSGTPETEAPAPWADPGATLLAMPRGRAATDEAVFFASEPSAPEPPSPETGAGAAPEHGEFADYFDDDVAPDAAAEIEAPLTFHSTRAESLSAKIEALEAVIGQTRDQWEPDGTSAEPYSGTPAQPIGWTDAEGEGAREDDPRSPTIEDAAKTADADDRAAARSAADPEVEDLAADEAVIDEDSLRELVAEIVRQELQGALGERITRNVRKLVRREIHRALAAQDLD